MSEDIFRQFWWLIFPISWFIFGAWQSWLSYRANRETLDLIKTYAAAGREPVDLRCRNKSTAVCTDIAVPHIIGQDDDNVRLGWRRLPLGNRRQQAE